MSKPNLAKGKILKLIDARWGLGAPKTLQKASWRNSQVTDLRIDVALGTRRAGQAGGICVPCPTMPGRNCMPDGSLTASRKARSVGTPICWSSGAKRNSTGSESAGVRIGS